MGIPFAPARLPNSEGEELVLRRTVCETAAGADAVVAALDATYERQGDHDAWHEMAVLDGGDPVVRGVLHLDGPLLTVESNSEERQARILTTVAGLFDDTVVDDRELDGFDLDDVPEGALGMSVERIERLLGIDWR